MFKCSSQKFNSEISIEQINKVLDAIEENPDVTSREICAILDIPSRGTVRKYLAYLASEGDLSFEVVNGTNRYSIANRKVRVPTCTSYKMKANRHFGRTQVSERVDSGMPRVETVKEWVPIMVRDPLVAALFGQVKASGVAA